MTTTTKTLEALRLERITALDAEIAELREAVKACCDAIRTMPDAPLGEYGYRRWSDSINRWEARSLEFEAKIEDLQRRRDAILASGKAT